MVNGNRRPSAQELVPEFVSELYPGIIPLNVVVIVEALSLEHQRGLYAFANEDVSPWVLEGMLSLVRHDNLLAWSNYDDRNESWTDLQENDEE